MSSLGIEKAKDSKYAMSKLDGEKKIIKNFNKYIILKPSIIYSVDDNFTTNFMSLLNTLPIMPLYYGGKTNFRPIHVIDIVNIILEMIKIKEENLILECIGPEQFTFKEIILNLLDSIGKKRLLIPLPNQIAAFSAKLLQLLPKPLLTEDQFKLLKYNNVVSGIYKSNFDLGFKTNKLFKDEINKYSYNWKIGGQFANNKISKLK